MAGQAVEAPNLSERLNSSLELIPDYPIKGVLFRDIGPILADGPLFREMVKAMAEHYKDKKVEAILGLESRGFILGAALACEMQLPFIAVRKKGKLPGEVYSASYDKEYGPDVLEMRKNALKPNTKVVVVDDVLATGGTAEAACKLVKEASAEVVEVMCLLEIESLHGRDKVPAPVHIVIKG